MAAGIKAGKVEGIDALDLWAWNGWIDLAWYYLPTLDEKQVAELKKCFQKATRQLLAVALLLPPGRRP